MGGLIEAVLCGVHSMAKLPGGDDGLRGVVINTASIAAFEGQIGQVCRRPVNLTRILRACQTPYETDGLQCVPIPACLGNVMLRWRMRRVRVQWRA